MARRFGRPVLDPDAPRPRIPPVAVAIGLAVCGVLGAAAVSGIGRATLASDRETIQTLGASFAEDATALRGALRTGDEGAVDAACRLDGSTPRILEPLERRCLQARDLVRGVLASPDRDERAQRRAEAALDEIDAAFRDLLCLARLECP